ncbi:MAG: TetR family transcriptional regulator C-terminal domain-containing protein [Elusimicrobia bacterium]|nr:TetR family transcriptional regulator C-terminal domain-containing protein [Elusimicrobiota bacterium]
MARKSDPNIRTRIVKEAEHLMHLKGYRATSLDDIAAACSMTKANLLHHFASKEALGLAVLDYKVVATRGGCVDPLNGCCDPAAAVRNLFEGAAKVFRGNGCRAGCFVGNVAAEMSDVSEAFRERVSVFFEEWTGRLETALRRGKERALFKPALRPRAAAESVLALYQGALILARAHRDPDVLRRAGTQAAALIEAHRFGKKPSQEVDHGS